VTPAATWVTAFALLVLSARPAMAQRLVAGAGVGAGTGLERSDLVEDHSVRIARTRLEVPVDFRVDEDMGQGLGVVGLFEMAPRASVGADVRYLRWLGGSLVGFAGICGVFAPRTLFGVDFGVDFYLPARPSKLSLFLEPSFTAMALGSDLPDDRVLLWALVAVGVHADW
jgi:hypothetical protein